MQLLRFIGDRWMLVLGGGVFAWMMLLFLFGCDSDKTDRGTRYVGDWEPLRWTVRTSDAPFEDIDLLWPGPVEGCLIELPGGAGLDWERKPPPPIMRDGKRRYGLRAPIKSQTAAAMPSSYPEPWHTDPIMYVDPWSHP